TFDIEGITSAFASSFADGREISVRARRENGEVVEFRAIVRIDTPQEALYYRHGGILQYVLRQLLGSADDRPEPISGGVAAGAERDVQATDRSKVTEGSKESFPASDPPTY